MKKCKKNSRKRFFARRLASFLVSFFLFLTLWLTVTPGAFSDTETQPTDNPKAPDAVSLSSAPVTLGGEKLFDIQASLGVLKPEERAKALSERLTVIANDPSVVITDLEIKDYSSLGITKIVNAQQVIAQVSDDDAQAMHVPRTELAQQALEVIKKAILEYREARSLKRILLSLGEVLLATIILLIILKILQRLYKFSRNQLNRLHSRIPALRIGGEEIIASEQLFGFSSKINNVVFILLTIALFSIYVNTVLSSLPWTKSFSIGIFSLLFSAVSKIFIGIISYLPNLIFLAVLGYLTYYTLQFINDFFKKVVEGKIILPGFYADWAIPTKAITQFLFLALVATVAFPYLPGSGSGAFQGVSIFLGVLISLGSSTALSNIIAGVFLTYLRNFQIGDFVEISGVKGTVMDKGIMTTRLCTTDNYFISIPNSQILSSNITNFRDGVLKNHENVPPPILSIEVTVGYDVSWAKVHDMLLNIADLTENVLKNPAPFVEQIAHNNFHALYKLSVSTNNFAKEDEIRSELRQKFQDRCREEGIDMISPYYLVNR